MMRRAWKRLIPLLVKIKQQYSTATHCCAREYKTLTDQTATTGILQLANKKGMTCTVTHDHSVLHVSCSLSPACIIIYES